MGDERKGEWWEGVNLTKIYCKYFCKCHNVPPVQ
jgi:methylphosphotriester-DNA--protein-cysteine methyltransferase